MVAAAVLGVSTASVGAALGAEPQARLDPAATRVLGECQPGKGRIALTMLPTGAGAYEVTVKASRLPEGSRWRGDLIAFSTNGDDEVSRTFRRRAAQEAWSFTTTVTFEQGPGQTLFLVEARTPRSGGITCLVASSIGHQVIGFSLCGRGVNALLLRRRDDGTLVVRYVAEGTRDTRWRLELDVDSTEGRQGVAFDDLSNRRGVLSSRVELTSVAEDAVFVMRALSDRGTRCRIRINPGSQTAAVTGKSVSPRELIGRLALSNLG